MKGKLHCVNKRIFFKRIIISLIFALIAFNSNAQVGIGTEMPDPSAQLDVTVSTGDRGVLLARIALTSTTDQTTITTGNVESLLVYNTATQNDVTPGYYYWYDGSWQRLSVLGEHEETITTLIDNGDGTFTYTSEDGTDTTFTSGGVMSDNGDGTYTYTNPDGSDILIEGLTETLTVLEYDEITGIVSYTDEDGVTTQLDISIAIDDWETLTNLALNPDNIHLDYTDEDGVTHQIDLTALVQNLETVTTIVANADGTFTYTDEDGNTTTINVSNLETLTSLVLNADGKTLEYTDEDGITSTIDLEVVITNFGIVTTIVAHADGTITYTDEDGNTTVIDITDLETLTTIALNPDNTHIDYTDEVGNVTQLDLTALVQNLETLTQISVDPLAGNLIYIDENGDTNLLYLGTLVRNEESVTNLAYNAVTGIITYTNENGVLQTIDLANVINDFETVTLLIPNADGTFTYYNEDEIGTDGQPMPSAPGVVIDPMQVSVQFNAAANSYEFFDAGGNVIATIDLNASNIAYDNTDSGLTATDVQDALDELVSNLEAGAGVTLIDNTDGTFTLEAENGDNLGTISKADLTDHTDGSYTFTNNDGTDVTFDVLSVDVQFNAAANSYEFFDAGGNVIATIDLNASKIGYDNTDSGLTSTDDTDELDEFVSNL